jgi:hypothetical protein
MIDALGGTRRTSGGSVAGPTAFHRAKSWPPRDKRIVRRGWVSATWHIYDNKGSYNGWFDTLPEWMRMGPWAPMAFVFMFILYGSLLSCPPQPLVFPASPTSGTWWWADVCVFLWGCIVVVEGWRHLSMLAFAVSYTGWSWCILTSRAGLCALAPILEPHAPAAAAWAAAAGSALRFPALAAAVITFTVWNTMLLPILYLLILPQQARPNFLKFNFGEFLFVFKEREAARAQTVLLLPCRRASTAGRAYLAWVCNRQRASTAVGERGQGGARRSGTVYFCLQATTASPGPTSPSFTSLPHPHSQTS